MDNLLLDWLNQAPMVVVVLIVTWRIAAQITAREQQRDADAAELDKTRVAAAQAAQEANDHQMDRMIELQASQQTIQTETNKMLGAMSTALQTLNQKALEIQADTRAYLAPIAEDLPVVKADVQALTKSVKHLENGNEAILAAIQELSKRPNVTPESLIALTSEVQALRVQTERLAQLIPAQPATMS